MKSRLTSNNPQAMGLSVVEVLVALAILGIVTAAVVTTYLGSIQTNADSGRRTQSAQILNSIGRRVAGGDTMSLAQPGTPIVLDYGELGSAYPEMRGDGVSDPSLYRVKITNIGVVSLESARVVHYQIEVCTQSFVSDEESCLIGNTASVAPGPPTDGPIELPEVN